MTAVTNGDLLLTLLLFVFAYLLFHPRWHNNQKRFWSFVGSVERILEWCFFMHVMQSMNNTITLSCLANARRYFAIALTLNWSYAYAIMGIWRTGVHLCEYPDYRFYAEPFGFCIKPEVVPMTVRPWYLETWTEQSAGMELARILPQYVEPIFIGDLQINAIRQSLMFRVERLQLLRPDDPEREMLTQSLEDCMNATAHLESEWEDFSSKFCIGKDMMNHDFSLFLDMFITLASQKRYPMWSWTMLVFPGYHALGILNRMSSEPLGPAPWLYDLEVAVEMRYRTVLLNQAFNGVLRIIDRKNPQTIYLKEAQKNIASIVRKVEEARSDLSWPKFLFSQKEATALAKYQDLLEQINDCLHQALVVTDNWQTSHGKLLNSLRPLNDLLVQATWNKFPPSRFSPTGSLTMPQNRSIEAEDSPMITRGNESDNPTVLNMLFSYDLARPGRIELSDARSAILSLCNVGNIYGNSKDNLFPICIIYQYMMILSDIDGAALTERPRSWQKTMGDAREEFEKQSHGSMIVIEDIKRMSMQKWYS